MWQNTTEGHPQVQIRSGPVHLLSPEQARKTLKNRLTPTEFGQLQIPYEADESIKRTAFNIVAQADTDRQKLSRLVAFFRKRGFLENYNRDGTKTAQQVWESGKGNCLSYANLFVSMARTVGLHAFYLDASEIVSELAKSGSVFVNYGHMLAGVQFGPEMVAVDFDGHVGNPKRFRKISDMEAIADFYNNLGYEKAWSNPQQGGFASEQCLFHFYLATRIAPGSARPWNNLGVALSRAGQAQSAAKAYQNAIQAKPDFAAAHSNLGHVYKRSNKLEKAIQAFQMAIKHDSDNPHYHFFLGKTLVKAGQKSQALAAFAQAGKMDDKLFLPHLESAYLHCKSENWTDTREALRRVLQIVPKQRDATLILDRFRQAYRTSPKALTYEHLCGHLRP